MALLTLARLSYLVAIFLVAPPLYLFSTTRVAAVLVAGCSSVAMIVWRVGRGPPRNRAGWTLIAVATALMTVGDTIFAVATTGIIEAADFPGRTDLFFLIAYFPLAVGLMLLAGPPVYRSLPTIIDICLLSLAGSLLIWITVLRPALTSENESTFAASVAIASSVGYVAVLAGAIGTLITFRGRLSVLAITLGVASFLVANLIFIRARVVDSWGSSVTAGFLLLAVVVAAGIAAMLPERELPAARSRRVLRPTSLLTIAAALLVAPTVLLVEATTGSVATGMAIGIIAVIEAALVTFRLSIAVAEGRRKASRNAVVRATSRRLALATTEQQVQQALRDALQGMLPGVRSNIAVVAPAEPRADGERVYRLDAESAGTPRRTAHVTAPPHDLDEIDPFLASLADQAGVALARLDLSRQVNEKDRERFFQRIVASSEEVILISSDDRIGYVSPSASRMFGRDVRGDRFDDLVRAPDGRHRRWPDAQDGGEALVERPDGTHATVLVHRRDLTRDPTIRGVITTLRDVTAERELRRDLEHRATHDPLTGLANASLFRESLRESATLGTRAVLIVDVDDFKIVNDTFGHQVGDELLVVVGARITASIREVDLAARVGGDEFAVLLRDVEPGQATAITRRVSEALARPASLAQATVNTRSSIGLAFAPGGDDGETLLRHADTALYAAKAAGKGRWSRYAPGMPAPSRQRPEVRNRLATALSGQGIGLHYQPIVETASGRVVGFEGLARMTDGPPMSPTEIADAAEAAGLAAALGGWALSRGLADLQVLTSAANGGNRFVAVNVPGSQLRLADFAERVWQALDTARADPRNLVLEISDVDLGEDAWRQLTELTNAGVRVAIDDYGVGNASLGHLRQPAVGVIKLDASFLAGPASPRSRRLLEAITDLSGTLRLQQVAQGVRDPQARAMLVDLGCGYAQGPLFSPPLPVEAAATWSLERSEAA